MAHVLERRREPCRILEIIAPGGFERYFEELVDVLAAGPLDPEKVARRPSPARYGLELDVESVDWLCQRYGLSFGGLPGYG